MLQAISGLNINSGGPSQSVYNLTKQLRNNKIDAQILTFNPNNTSDKNISDEDFIHTFSISRFNLTQYSKLFLKYLDDSDNDIYHGHGLWQLPVHRMAKFALRKNKPYIITPRGMLRPWALEQRGLKKQIALRLYQKEDLDNADCVHATSQKEADEIRALGFKNPIAVIPNGVDLTKYPMRKEKFQNSRKTILYLSRVFPKKGLENLIEAWVKIDFSIRNDWSIIIAGNGTKTYINQLNRLISENKLENEIKFIGPKYGQDKINVYHQADLFILPTLGENFGMVVAEALACSVPVITTIGAPWQELQTHNAGWWIDIGVKPLAKALTEAMQLNDGERHQMGLNGRKLVEENYSIEIVAQKMIQLYEWILYKSEKPEFVI